MKPVNSLSHSEETMSYNIAALEAVHPLEVPAVSNNLWRPRFIHLTDLDVYGLTNGHWAVYPDGYVPVPGDQRTVETTSASVGGALRPLHRGRRVLSGAEPEPAQPPCPTCQGTNRRPCFNCNGKTKRQCRGCTNGVVTHCSCPNCSGHTCRQCDGKGNWTCRDCVDGTETCNHRAGDMDEERIRREKATPYVRVGFAAVNARIWDLILGFADDETIGITNGGPFEGVTIFGDWWKALIMPMRPHDEQPCVLTVELEAS